MLQNNQNLYRLSQPLSWSGVGVHTGQTTTVSISPAEAGTGIKWCREDIDPELWITANARTIVGTIRSTDIGNKSFVIKTVEHLMAALLAAQITDIQIKVNGPEVPILDGSAGVFYRDLLANRGAQIEEDGQFWCPDEIIQFTDEGSGASYTILPSDTLSIEVSLDYDLSAGYQLHTSYHDSEDFLSWCDARTFVLSSELAQLCEHDLIKGGNLDNALVIPDHPDAEQQLADALQQINVADADSMMAKYKEGVGLHTADELARHKLVDLMGDLALLDLPIKAKIIARKPGHTGNTALVKYLRPLLQKEVKVGGYVRYEATTPVIHDTQAIHSILPHRYPFALVDKIIEQSESHVVGVKNITFNEGLFQGHFPHNPVFPGVLQMEALAQTGGILALSTVENPSDWDTYFLKMENVKFKRKVVPGDTLILRMKLASPIRRGIVHMFGTAFVGNEVASEGELTAQIVDRTKQ